MSKGTFSKTLTVTVQIETAVGSIKCEGIEVEAKGSWDYDPGCRYTANGDGWPPSLDFELEKIANPDAVVSSVVRRLLEAGVSVGVRRSDIIEAVIEAVEDALSEEDVREYASNNSED